MLIGVAVIDMDRAKTPGYGRLARRWACRLDVSDWINVDEVPVAGNGELQQISASIAFSGFKASACNRF